MDELTNSIVCTCRKSIQMLKDNLYTVDTERTGASQKVFFTSYPTYSQSSYLSECSHKFAAEKCDCIEDKLYTPISSPYNLLRKSLVYQIYMHCEVCENLKQLM